MTDTNALSLSDEDFRDAMPPVVEPEAKVVEEPIIEKKDEPVVEQQAADPVTDPVKDEAKQADLETDKKDEKVSDPKPGEATDEEVLKGTPPPSVAEGEAKDKVGEPKEVLDGGVAKVEEQAKTEVAAEDQPFNYEENYNKIVGSIKADGKTFEVKSPEEAIKLMQQGVHYGRKMQELAQHNKTIMTLAANNIDQSKLSYLIDLDKKNPEAIKKLIKDSGIDPLEFDANTESTYQASNHLVSDEEVNFRTVMDDVKSSPTGQETLNLVHTTWDMASKDKLWQDPEILRAIDEQRASGIYDRITSEVSRLKTLGHIPQSTSFLESYTQVGDTLAASGVFQDLVKTEVETPTPPVRTVLETKADTPKPVVKDNERAAAAAASSSTPKQIAPKINPLGMSDEEFLKQSAPR